MEQNLKKEQTKVIDTLFGKVVVTEKQRSGNDFDIDMMNSITKSIDNVNHPAHYTKGGIECIDAMISVFGEETIAKYCHINAFKYLWRSENKNGVEDIKKAIWYLNKYVELYKEVPKKKKK